VTAYVLRQAHDQTLTVSRMHYWPPACHSVVVPEAQHRARGGGAEAGRQQQDLGRVSTLRAPPRIPLSCVCRDNSFLSNASVDPKQLTARVVWTARFAS
jgi:hypothetical protein